MVDPPSYSLSPPLTPAQLEDLYRTVVLQESFYGSDYGSAWRPEPYGAMARALCELLQPRKHVDIGCGKGFFVSAMRQAGVDSFGIDYSSALLSQAPPDVQPFLITTTTEEWITRATFSDVDLISFMEVFEHLPLRTSIETLQLLRSTFPGKLFLTIPSYGVDSRFRVGLCTNAEQPGWQTDMIQNVPFHNIVLYEGIPHHGHITLCSYRWWTELFLYHGWVRSRDLETKLAKSFRPFLVDYKWNPYLLEPMPRDYFELDFTSTPPLGTGWHEPEKNGRWTDGRAEVYVFCSCVSLKRLVLEIIGPPINVIQDYSLIVLIERLIQGPDYAFSWHPEFISNPIPLTERDKPQSVTIDLRDTVTAPFGTEEPLSLFRCTLLSPSFQPREYGFSGDDRTLGLFCSRLTLRT